MGVRRRGFQPTTASLPEVFPVTTGVSSRWIPYLASSEVYAKEGTLPNSLVFAMRSERKDQAKHCSLARKATHNYG